MLTNNIIQHGAPTKLVSNYAQIEISKKVQEILCNMHISSWQSEPHHQYQNPTEHCYQDVKCMCNMVLDHTCVPAHCWLLYLAYIYFVLNSAYSANLRGTPSCPATGSTNDISPLLCFDFYEPVYYHMDNMHFPSVSC